MKSVFPKFLMLTVVLFLQSGVCSTVLYLNGGVGTGTCKIAYPYEAPFPFAMVGSVGMELEQHFHKASFFSISYRHAWTDKSGFLSGPISAQSNQISCMAGILGIKFPDVPAWLYLAGPSFTFEQETTRWSFDNYAGAALVEGGKIVVASGIDRTSSVSVGVEPNVEIRLGRLALKGGVHIFYNAICKKQRQVVSSSNPELFQDFAPKNGMGYLFECGWGYEIIGKRSRWVD
jgi:hypothetical protein